MSLRAAELIRCHRLLISGFLSCLHLDLVPSKGTKVLDHEQVGLRRAPCGPSCDCDMVPSVVHVLYQLCVHQQSTTRRHLHAFYWRISGVYFPFRVVLHPRIKVLAETVFFFFQGRCLLLLLRIRSGVLRISRYSGFLCVVPTNTWTFLRGLKLCRESRT